MDDVQVPRTLLVKAAAFDASHLLVRVVPAVLLISAFLVFTPIVNMLVLSIYWWWWFHETDYIQLAVPYTLLFVAVPLFAFRLFARRAEPVGLRYLERHVDVPLSDGFKADYRLYVAVLLIAAFLVPTEIVFCSAWDICIHYWV